MGEILKKGKGRGKKPPPGLRSPASSLQESQPSTAYPAVLRTSSLKPVIPIFPAPQPWKVSHTVSPRIGTVKAVERHTVHSTFRDSSVHFQTLSTSALPPSLSSDSMRLCACESVFYLHYPCLLLATETKYFKAKKASLPIGLLLFTLLPAQERRWWRILPATIVCAFSSHVLGSQDTW